MKTKNILVKGMATLMIAGGLASCSSNYLEQPPITTVSDDQIGESLEGVTAAMYGLCQAMYIGQYGDVGIRRANGEGYLRTFYGDSGTEDYWNPWLYGYQTDAQLWAMMLHDSGTAANFGWMYGYNLINQANVILEKIGSVPVENENDEKLRDFTKAQTLTMRAHAYIRLMQLYAPRFEDSDNGEELAVILREDPGTDPMPLSTYKQCVKFIYDDLDEAIALYESSGLERDFGFEPDLSIAQALYSRLALLNHDFPIAQKMAHDARQGYPIMSADDFKKGFMSPNDEWMWYNDPDMTYNGYNSWGASFTCNGAYAVAYNWSSAGNIGYTFYKKAYAAHPDDVRLEQFWTPDKANKYVDLKIPESDFWGSDGKINGQFGFMYGKDMDEKICAAISIFMQKMAPGVKVEDDGSGRGTGPYTVDVTLTEANAKNAIRRREWYRTKGVQGCDGRVQFGAQVKFWSDVSERGATSIPFFRAAELLLNEAEAAYENEDYTTAQKCMVELNSKRIPNYTCNLSGQALLDEIRLTRRIELWGEGDTWFSFKRWNLPIIRTVKEVGDPQSNNMFVDYKGSYPVSFNNGWRMRYPRAEKNYNPIIVSQLGQ